MLPALKLLQTFGQICCDGHSSRIVRHSTQACHRRQTAVAGVRAAFGTFLYFCYRSKQASLGDVVAVVHRHAVLPIRVAACTVMCCHVANVSAQRQRDAGPPPQEQRTRGLVAHQVGTRCNGYST